MGHKAEHKAKEETERQAETVRKATDEAELKVKAAADRKAKEETRRQTETVRKATDEAELKARTEIVAVWMAEADRQAKEDAEADLARRTSIVGVWMAEAAREAKEEAEFKARVSAAVRHRHRVTAAEVVAALQAYLEDPPSASGMQGL